LEVFDLWEHAEYLKNLFFFPWRNQYNHKTEVACKSYPES
jgi:hypothetical protein